MKLQSDKMLVTLGFNRYPRSAAAAINFPSAGENIPPQWLGNQTIHDFQSRNHAMILKRVQQSK